MADAIQFVFRHEHLIIDAELKAKLAFPRRRAITTNLIEKLLHELGMERLAPLGIYDATDPRFPGWSFIQPITTSHISGHYFEEVNAPSHIHMDVYSCKEYRWQNIFPILDEALKLDQWSANLVIRSAKIAQETHKVMTGKEANIIEILDMAFPRNIVKSGGAQQRVD